MPNPKIYANLNQKSISWITDLSTLAIYLLLFYSFYLGAYPLFTPDEARYAEVAREMIAAHDYITPRVDGVAFLDKPILYYWLQVIAIKLFGLKEWALRFFPAFLGAFGVLSLYVCGRILFNRATGFFSAFVLSTSLLYFAHAHYANLDLEVAVFITTSLLLFLIGIETQRTILIYGGYVFAALAFLTKGLIGLFFPCAIIGVWFLVQRTLSRSPRDPGRTNGIQRHFIKNLRIPTGLFLFFLIIVPWYWMVQKENPAFFHFFFVTQQVTRFLSQAEFNNQSPVWFYLPIILVGFFPWSIFLVEAIKESLIRFRIPTYSFLLIMFTVVFIFFSIPHSKIMGYILPTFPPLALIVGNYIARYWQQISKQQLRFNLITLQVTASILATLIIIALHFHLVDLPTDAAPFLYVISIFLFTSVFIACFLYSQQSLKALFVTCAALSLSMLFTLLISASYLNQNTTHPLIKQLQPMLKPDDEIVNYYKFFYDTPIYLGRRITIVNDWHSPHIIHKDNWERELWFGMPFQKTADWLIDEKQFWRRWGYSHRVFVFINNNYMDHFKRQAQQHSQTYYVLSKYQDVFLVSNSTNVQVSTN